MKSVSWAKSTKPIYDTTFVTVDQFQSSFIKSGVISIKLNLSVSHYHSRFFGFQLLKYKIINFFLRDKKHRLRLVKRIRFFMTLFLFSLLIFRSKLLLLQNSYTKSVLLSSGLLRNQMCNLHSSRNRSHSN